MATIQSLADEIIQLQNKNLLSSDAFQTACREFSQKTKDVAIDEYQKITELFSNDTKNYIQAMEAMLSGKDFMNKYKDRLKF